MQPIIERAPPKINLTLRILGRRPDGYHELSSLVAFATDLADTITLTPGSSTSVTTTGTFGPSIAGENLVKVTLDLLARQAPDLTLGAVELVKHLPIAAGIGGGSADAAAVLRAVRRANPAASGLDWVALATRIGADVPVCLQSAAQMMTGIGECLSDVAALPQLYAVLVNPQVPVPADKTAQVFRALAAPALKHPPPVHDRLTFESSPAMLAYMTANANDLLPAARQIVPIIDRVLAALEACPGCGIARLSGGGPTCFGIFPDMQTAQNAAANLAQSHPTWWVRASLLV